jgi:uncharacterized iron-regulated membrane protein
MPAVHNHVLSVGKTCMKIKRVFFWAHLCCAIAAATFILIMSVTGVLLAYEHQLVAHAEQRNHVAVAPATVPLAAERLAEFARAAAPRAAGATLRFAAEATAPVAVQLGREGTLLLNPYTGALIEDAAAGTRNFLRLMEDWHRTLDFATRDTGRAITGASNLVFLFLVLSGI